MRPKGSGKQLERRRQRAVALLKEGHAPVEVARLVGADRRSVRRWNAAHRKQGANGLAARPVPGRPCKLSARQRAQLETMLVRGAAANGFESDLWTCPRVAQVITRRFGIRYHVDHIGRLLRSLGWTPQRPARRAMERDEDGIQHWVKQEWPQIKKSPAPERMAGFSRRERPASAAGSTPHLEPMRADPGAQARWPQPQAGLCYRRFVRQP